MGLFYYLSGLVTRWKERNPKRKFMNEKNFRWIEGADPAVDSLYVFADFWEKLKAMAIDPQSFAAELREILPVCRFIDRRYLDHHPAAKEETFKGLEKRVLALLNSSSVADE